MKQLALVVVSFLLLCVPSTEAFQLTRKFLESSVVPSSAYNGSASLQHLASSKNGLRTLGGERKEFASPLLSNVSARFAADPSKGSEADTTPPVLDLRGKKAFVAGVSDTSGYGWAIAKELANAGADIIFGTWPPTLVLFEKSLSSGRFDADMWLINGKKMNISKIYPLDATFDNPEAVPTEVKQSKRYSNAGRYTIEEVASDIKKDFGNIDIFVHSLANGPEVKKSLLETSRHGYLSANSASAYSLVSLVQNIAPIMNEGGSVLSLTYRASDVVIPGYGGGMSSAKAALESDTKTLAWEAGRKYGIRINSISAGPLKSRAANAIGDASKGDKNFIDYAIDYAKVNSPLNRDLTSDDVGRAALFLLSPLAAAITGQIIYVDNGLSIMGHAVDSKALQG